MCSDNDQFPSGELDSRTPTAELKQMFEDSSLDVFAREHAYFNYWRRRMDESRRLARSELSEILRHREWLYGAQSIVIQGCQVEAISRADAEWLIQKWPENDFLIKQLSAFLVLNYSSLETEDRLRALLDLNVGWATTRFIRDLPPEERGTAERLVGESGHSKRQKEFFLGVRLW